MRKGVRTTQNQELVKGYDLTPAERKQEEVNEIKQQERKENIKWILAMYYLR